MLTRPAQTAGGADHGASPRPLAPRIDFGAGTGTYAIAVARTRPDLRIIALNVLHELGDAALAAMPALLAPGGRAAFVDWNGDIERPHGPPRDHSDGATRAGASSASAFACAPMRAFPSITRSCGG